MIPVDPRPEPKNFHANVRVPGLKFLTKFPNPTKDDWKKGCKIWARASNDLFTEYRRVCSYSAEWIKVKERSVDHYLPRSVDKTKAFEWSNFRLASKIINEYKSASIVLDPFKVGRDWFVIDFDANIVKPNSVLDEITKEQVRDTIKILKLNNTVFQNKRIHWIDAYYHGRTGLGGLRKKAPFLVYELERQEMTEAIKVKHQRFLEMTKKRRF